MIPRAYITAWRNATPWPTNEQVEQDLVISRALVEMFSRKSVADQVAFRGGTALHKLFFGSSGRYSEDIDLVQRNSGSIGDLIDEIKSTLDPWLGIPKWKQGEGRFTLIYRFETTFAPITNMRLKIEINTREHFSVMGISHKQFSVDNPWFAGSTEVSVYHLDELLGTKMRALYQRKKGRDLFDLWMALNSGMVNPSQIIECFLKYIELEGNKITRAAYEANLAEKLKSSIFVEDIEKLIPAGFEYDLAAAAGIVKKELIEKLL